MEENEKHGAGDFHVSWEVEVVMSFGLSSIQTSLKCHLNTYINSSMQACVFMVFHTYVPFDSLNIRINIDIMNNF